MTSSTGTPRGKVVFRSGPNRRIVGRAILIHGVAHLKVNAGTRPGIRHFIAIYKGTARYAPSTSGRVRLVVLPALLPNTGARWRAHILS